MNKILNFIDGKYTAPIDGKYLDNFDPSTGRVYSQVADSSAVDMVQAIAAARRAFESWSKTNAEERAKLLCRIADLIEARIEDFAKAESQDVGKPYWLALKMDIPRAIANFRFFAGKILTLENKSSVMPDAINYSVRQPVGVCGLIAPWNLPFYLMTWKLAPCLAMGNTAVCKPSELTSRTTVMLGDILNEAGVPQGVVNIVLGRGDTVGATLVSHPAVPVISFTGGTSTGLLVQNLAAPQFKKVSLELGGKNANIIFKDADLEKAAEMSVKSSFLNSGQICLCGSRLLIQEDIYDDFMKIFLKKVAEIKVGPSSEEGHFMGPLVSKEHLDKVMSCIERAKTEGGKVIAGGKPPEVSAENKNGYYLLPTVIEDLSNCSDLWQEEIFGPVITTMTFKYPKDAVKWANNSPYGLSASLWTQDIKRAHKIAQEIDAGTIWINTWMKRDLRVPFGGMKASGIGREGGEHSMDIYSEYKNICVSLEK